MRPQCASELAIHSGCGCSASEEVKDEHHDTDDDQDMNNPSGDVKGEESKQPENDENCGDQCKHVLTPFISSACQ